MGIPAWVTNPFLKQYLRYVENTEPPTIMKLWAAVTCGSAALGRHAWLESGTSRIFPNMYVLLVGPPGTRKSTAINQASKLLKTATEVKFAPDDTGGQRQGLIVAMEDTYEELSDLQMDQLLGSDVLDLSELAEIKIDVNKDDKHVLFVCATEFGSFIGQNSLELTRFLIKMWDGEHEYKYKIRNVVNVLQNPLLTLVGGTTATDIAALLPPEAIGQGFMSRIVLVFAANKEKRIARPKLLTDLAPELEATYRWMYYDMRGPMQESVQAKQMLDSIYIHGDVSINDTRFMYYTERRHTHLTKLAMVLAALRRSSTIETQDVEHADIMLSETEDYMPEALGEYGLSPIAAAKQKMLEFIQHANGPVHDDILWLVMRRDMKLIDFRNCISELLNANKILKVDTNRGAAFILKDSTNEMIELLSTDEPDLEGYANG